MLVHPLGRVISAKVVQYVKALLAMLVTVDGIVIFSNPLAPLNAFCPTVVMPCGSVTDFNCDAPLYVLLIDAPEKFGREIVSIDSHPDVILPNKFVTSPGIVKDFSLRRYWNDESVVTTFLGIVMYSTPYKRTNS